MIIICISYHVLSWLQFENYIDNQSSFCWQLWFWSIMLILLNTMTKDEDVEVIENDDVWVKMILIWHNDNDDDDDDNDYDDDDDDDNNDDDDDDDDDLHTADDWRRDMTRIDNLNWKLDRNSRKAFNCKARVDALSRY